MAKAKRDGLLIAGGGLAGSLAALAMAKSRPEVPILLVHDGERFGRDHVWTFFEDELDEQERALVEPLIGQRWPGYYVAFPGNSRKFKAICCSVRSDAIERAVRETLRPDQYRLGTKVVAVREDALMLQGGERIAGEGAIDARGAANLSMLELGWRKSFGREYEFAEPHQLDRPVLIDATVDQSQGFRFFQCLPFDRRRMLVEEVEYAQGPDLQPEAAGARLDAYLARRGWTPVEVEREESGILPVPTGGDFGAFWRVGGARVAKLGLRGGFFHPVTGNSLPDSARMAVKLAEQRDLDGAALHDLFEAQANALWKKRDFYRSFNKSLVGGGGYDAFEGLYSLDPGVIARFHGAQLGMLDRMRVSSAKPAPAAKQKAR